MRLQIGSRTIGLKFTRDETVIIYQLAEKWLTEISQEDTDREEYLRVVSLRDRFAKVIKVHS